MDELVVVNDSVTLLVALEGVVPSYHAPMAVRGVFDVKGAILPNI